MNSIETLPIETTDRKDLLLTESAWRRQTTTPARPHRVRRNRHALKQLSPRPAARRDAPSLPSTGITTEVADETLLAGLRDGDIAAGETLVARYHGSLMRYLQRLAGPDLAEELHQQTWLSVLDHLGRFRPGSTSGTLSGHGGGFKAWLFRIATNKANDLWRSRGRERNAKEGLKHLLDPHLPGTAHRFETVERNDALAAALDQLPREQREALVLRFYSNMKFTDIAKLVGCPVNTALTRVHKAILKLRQIMEPA